MVAQYHNPSVSLDSLQEDPVQEFHKKNERTKTYYAFKLIMHF